MSERRLSAVGGAYSRIFDVPGGAGPLAGVRVAVKDIIDMAGERTRCGSPLRAEVAPASQDALAVARLRAAGATFVGKTALHEFAFGATGINPWEGTPDNPRAPGRIPGGSSSGSAAAVAEGTADVALGTDTGGSVRIPAAFCGVVGFKPSFDLIPTGGVFPLAFTLDHVGVLAADVTLCRRVLAVLAPDASWEAPPPKRIGVDRHAIAAADPEVRAAVEEALARLGCELVDVELPGDEVFKVSTAIIRAEAASTHRRTLAATPERYGPDMRRSLELASKTTAVEYLNAMDARGPITARVRHLLGTVDAVAMPTIGFVAPPPADSETLRPGIVANTRLWNLVGLPAVSVPVPSAGFPVGLQLAALTDARALAAATALEAALR